MAGCKAKVTYNGDACCNSDVCEGFCLTHLKQKNPIKAEEYQRDRLKKEFGLTDFEINKIKEVNGNLNYVSKGFADFVKYSHRGIRPE